MRSKKNVNVVKKRLIFAGNRNVLHPIGTNTCGKNIFDDTLCAPLSCQRMLFLMFFSDFCDFFGDFVKKKGENNPKIAKNRQKSQKKDFLTEVRLPSVRKYELDDA